MTLIRTTRRERLTPQHASAGEGWLSSAGLFVIRGDGTARFDRHYHHFDELWCIAEGAGTIRIGDTEHDVHAGDILHTPAGQEHDILSVTAELRIFWISGPVPPGAEPGHLHRTAADAVKHLIPAAAHGQEHSDA